MIHQTLTDSDLVGHCHQGAGNTGGGLWLDHDTDWLEVSQLIWGYALVCFRVNDRAKLWAYRTFNPQAPEWLTKSSIIAPDQPKRV